MTIKINLTKGPLLKIEGTLKISGPAQLLAGNKIIEKFKKVKEESGLSGIIEKKWLWSISRRDQKFTSIISPISQSKAMQILPRLYYGFSIFIKFNYLFLELFWVMFALSFHATFLIKKIICSIFCVH